MDYLSNVNANSNFNLALSWGIGIALGEPALNLDRALCCFQRAVELDQERVSNGFDLGAVETGKNFAQQLSMFLQ